MKKIILTIIISVCIALVLPVGCTPKNNYAVYTNMPQDGYKLCADNFSVQETISGYKGEDRTFDEADTSQYTTKARTYYYMNCYSELTVAADFNKEEEVQKYDNFYHAVGDKLSEIEKAISPLVMDSDIYRFNNAAAGAKIEVGKITYEVLTEALAVHNFTDGYYNPALYYNITAYGFGFATERPKTEDDLPDDDRIAKYTQLASHFVEIKLTEEEGKYFVAKPVSTVEVGSESLTLKLDLGGIGKGYAVDCVEELFDEYGYNYGYFNFGLSSILVKSNVKNIPFNLYLTSPRSLSGDAYLQISVRDEKFSTSGDNEEFYNIAGKRYCHIIDPTTGKPVDKGIMSATVIGGSAAEDDALTTAIMAMGKDKAIQFIQNKLNDRRVVFTCE